LQSHVVFVTAFIIGGEDMARHTDATARQDRPQFLAPGWHALSWRSRFMPLICFTLACAALAAIVYGGHRLMS